MPVEPFSLSALLLAGASAIGATAGGALVEEITKDAYAKFKAKLSEFRGAQPADVLAILEANPTDAAARAALIAATRQLEDAQRQAILPLAQAFADALGRDEAARTLARERGQISLTLDVAGNITLARIVDATSINVSAQAGGDFSLTDVNMANRQSSGN